VFEIIINYEARRGHAQADGPSIAKNQQIFMRVEKKLMPRKSFVIQRKQK